MLTPPAVEIRGATVHDQRWIDGTIEAGVQGLGWKRPGPRPPEWDAPRASAKAARPPAKIAVEASGRATEQPPVPKPPPRWLQMLRRQQS